MSKDIAPKHISQRIEDARSCFEISENFLYDAIFALAVFKKSNVAVDALNHTVEGNVFNTIRQSLYNQIVVSLRKIHEGDKGDKSSIKRAIKELSYIDDMEVISGFESAHDKYLELIEEYDAFWEGYAPKLKLLREQIVHGSLDGEISQNYSLKEIDEIITKTIEFLDNLNLILFNSTTGYELADEQIHRFSKVFWESLSDGYLTRKGKKEL